MYFDRNPLGPGGRPGARPGASRPGRDCLRSSASRQIRDLAVGRVKEVARATTTRPIEFEVMDDTLGTTVVLAMCRDDKAEAMRVHEAVIEVCRAEDLPLNTIVNLVPGRRPR